MQHNAPAWIVRSCSIKSDKLQKKRRWGEFWGSIVKKNR